MSDWRDWWSSFPINLFNGAPFCLNDYISYHCFEDIMQALCLTNLPHPPYTDRFLDIWQMIDELNQYYMMYYIPGWISCINESMSVWLNKFCPGWTLEQVVDSVKIFIHCQKEKYFVTKIMSCCGVLIRVEDHVTFCDVENTDESRLRIQFKYPEPISTHN